jgi:hypothetical protein
MSHYPMSVHGPDTQTGVLETGVKGATTSESQNGRHN